MLHETCKNDTMIFSLYLHFNQNRGSATRISRMEASRREWSCVREVRFVAQVVPNGELSVQQPLRRAAVERSQLVVPDDTNHTSLSNLSESEKADAPVELDTQLILRRSLCTQQKRHHPSAQFNTPSARAQPRERESTERRTLRMRSRSAQMTSQYTKRAAATISTVRNTARNRPMLRPGH